MKNFLEPVKRLFKNEMLVAAALSFSALYARHPFIILAESYFGVLFILSLGVAYIATLRKSDKIVPFLKIWFVSLIVSTVIFCFIGYLIGKNNTEVTYDVPAQGYITRGAGGIYFTFKGVGITRRTNAIHEVLRNDSENFPNAYIVRLSLRESFPKIYYIESLQLVKKGQ